MQEWLAANPELLWWAGLFSVVSYVGTLVIIPLFVARIPADYFLSRRPPEKSWRALHPVLRWTGLILKNVLGAILIAAGIAMLIAPGQGLLTMLIGVSLLNFPGKRGLEIRLLRQSLVWKPINWIRKKANRPPLVLPDGTIEIDSDEGEN